MKVALMIILAAALAGSVSKTALPVGKNPADYGADERGYYWQDGIVQTDKYELKADATITTHARGVIVYATTIYINGTINVAGLGGESGYDANSRAGMMAILTGHGELDENRELLLYGAPGCSGFGGGYVILHAANIYVNGVIDARGANCATGGVIYLEGQTQIKGAVYGGMVVQR
jgi:hypothetical protein